MYSILLTVLSCPTLSYPMLCYPILLYPILSHPLPSPFQDPASSPKLHQLNEMHAAGKGAAKIERCDAMRTSVTDSNLARAVAMVKAVMHRLGKECWKKMKWSEGGFFWRGRSLDFFDHFC